MAQPDSGADDAKSLEWREIGARIRDGREAKQWTQAQLGDAIGTSKNDITLVEGGRPVSEDKLERIGDALGLTRPFLRYGIATGADARAIQRAAYDRAKRETLDRLRYEVDLAFERVALELGDLRSDLVRIVAEGARPERILERIAREPDPEAAMTNVAETLARDDATREATPKKAADAKARGKK